MRAEIGLEAQVDERTRGHLRPVVLVVGQLDLPRLTADRVEDEHRLDILARRLADELEPGADVRVEPDVVPELVALADGEASGHEAIVGVARRLDATDDDRFVGKEPARAARGAVDLDLVVLGPRPAERSAS